MGKKVLVTGGAGFMGSHLADDLLGLGFDVICLDDLSGGYGSNVPDGAALVRGSVAHGELVESLFAEHGFEHVFHLAAYAAEGLSHFIRHYNYTTNLLGSVNLINASVRHDVRCFVFASSIAVYGANQLPMTEDLTPSPEDPYGISKLAVELDLGAAHRLFGLDYVVFRPHNVYGEGQNIGDRYRNVVGIFMNQILKGQPMTIFGDGEQSRAFSYVRDVTPVIARSVLEPRARNEVFNVGADTPCSVKELARCVAQAMGAPLDVVNLPPRNEVVHAYSSHRKLREVFGDAAPTPLEEGLRRMAEWVRRVGARTTPRFGSIEIMKNLPPSWLAD